MCETRGALAKKTKDCDVGIDERFWEKSFVAQAGFFVKGDVWCSSGLRRLKAGACQSWSGLSRSMACLWQSLKNVRWHSASPNN